MSLFLILLISVVSIFFYYKYKSSQKLSGGRHIPIKTQQEKLQSLIDSKKYWGFQLSPINEAQSCQAVLNRQKKNFPINSVPALPLDDCTKNRCQCKHIGLVEKRTPLIQRRKTNDRRGSIRFEEISDRRSHMDRRSDNWTQHHQ